MQIQCFLQYLVTRASLRRDVFVDFVIPLSTKTYGCETILGKSLSRNGLKSIGFRWECREKIKKTSRDSSGGTGRLWRAGSALGGPGGALGVSGEALEELWEALSIYTNSRSTTPAAVMLAEDVIHLCSPPIPKGI